MGGLGLFCLYNTLALTHSSSSLNVLQEGKGTHRSHTYELFKLLPLIQNKADVGVTALKLAFELNLLLQVSVLCPLGPSHGDPMGFLLPCKAPGALCAQIRSCAFHLLGNTDTNTTLVLEINPPLISYSYFKSPLNSIIQISTNVTRVW